MRGGVAAKARQRDHFWDAARAFLMLLGIPYHVAMAYRAGHVWIVAPGQGAPVFTYLAELIHVFRMPAFFLIAGYFAAMLLTRRAPDEWLKGRVTKLAIPCAVAIVTLVPVLNLFAELSNFAWHDALASLEHNSATSGGYWVRHLWFIIVLLYCCVALAALVTWRPSLATAMMPARLDRRIAGHFALWVGVAAIALGLWEAVSIELFYKAGLATNLPQQILRIDDMLAYAPWFVVGCIVQRAPRTLERLLHFSPAVMLLAIGAMAITLVFDDGMWAPVGRFFETVAGAAMTQITLALMRTFLDRPIAVVRKLVDASFVIYLVHMPIVAMLVVAGQHVAMPVAPKAMLVMALTLALSYGAWMLVRRSPLLRLLYNGEPLPRRERVPALRLA